jgi:hypothetical protein
MRQAVGQFQKGQVLRTSVGEILGTRFHYEVRCEDCGNLLGEISFGRARSDHDPADSGLICGDCSDTRQNVEVRDREEAIAEAQAQLQLEVK